MHKKEDEIFLHEDCGYLYRHFQFVDSETSTIIASGEELLSETDLLVLYETNKGLAELDARLPEVLNPLEPEPTQLDRIEEAVNKSQQDIIDEYTLELIEGGVI